MASEKKCRDQEGGGGGGWTDSREANDLCYFIKSNNRCKYEQCLFLMNSEGEA